MKRLLALDIGITTGWAVWAHVQDEWTLFSWGEIYEEGYGAQLKHIVHSYKITSSIAERPVIIRGPLGDRLLNLMTTTEAVLSPLKVVDAANWKPSPSKNFPCPAGTSAHEKDAIRLGHWHLGRL